MQQGCGTLGKERRRAAPSKCVLLMRMYNWEPQQACQRACDPGADCCPNPTAAEPAASHAESPLLLLMMLRT